MQACPLFPLIYSLLSLSWIVDFEHVSEKQMMSVLFVLIKASIAGTLIKSGATISLKFQWQKFSLV